MSDVERLQERYCACADKQYRRAAGQFFTPRWIARGLARWVLDCNPDTIVDPAFGLGMLLDECSEQGYAGKLVGYEVDSALAATWRTEVTEPFCTLIEADFLHSDPGVLHAVVANPPYNRFQNRDIPAYILQQMSKVLREAPNGYTNQYALFLYAVLARLSISGRAAFIVPSEFLGTGYGVQVKKFLVRSRRLRHLVLFDTKTRIFPDAATTACVLLFDQGTSHHLSVWHLGDQVDQARFLSICDGSVASSADSTDVCFGDLDVERNWQGLGACEVDEFGLAELKTFGRVKRGIATGANEFFLLSEHDAKRLGISGAALVPCIAGANSVSGRVFSTSEWSALRKRGRRVYLFDGVSADTEAAIDYVSFGEARAYHLRYLTKMRRPWYRVEARGIAPLLLAVFGRSGFKAVLNQSCAVNLTAFHGFYPEAAYAELVPLIWLYLQTPLAGRAFERQQRRYGDGLKKLEPGDWGKLLVPDWRGWESEAMEHAHALAGRGAHALAQHDEVAWADSIEEFQHLANLQRTGRLRNIVGGVPTHPLRLFGAGAVSGSRSLVAASHSPDH